MISGFEESKAEIVQLVNQFRRNHAYYYSSNYREADVRQEFTDQFLKEIETWREVLARNIAPRNLQLSANDLSDAVQRLIDRIIFLRMAEDRGIEDYERLRRLAEGENIYEGFISLCRQAQAKYNAGLFDFHTDPIALRLAVEDKALKPILAGLYFPQSPYEFSVLPAEILGNVYEQFLGKVIRLTATHRAKVEEKPQVKKAGGVYYTPAYIVSYIVKNTVGKLVAGKSPQQLADLCVLDMACGSGSFLLGAYQYLLDYYLAWHSEHSPEQQPCLVWKHKDEWRLTTAEKKRILTTHIFGVDIDRQAVEVTKLSLLLKALEGENGETLGQQLALQEPALPNMDQNIKCGNSLIGANYLTGQFFQQTVAVPLGKITESSQGIILYKTAEDAERAEYTGFKPKKGWKKLLRGKNIGRYQTKWEGEYVSYGPLPACSTIGTRRTFQMSISIPTIFANCPFGRLTLLTRPK